MKLTFKKTNKNDTFNNFLTPKEQALIKKTMLMYFAFLMAFYLGIGVIFAGVIYFTIQCIKVLF